MAEAIICMKWFKYVGYWKAFSDYLSRKNLVKKILEHPLLTMPCDGMPARYVYDKPYHILIPSRSDWSTVPMHSGRKHSVWYKDGLKMDRNTGAGVYCPDEHLEYSWSLGNISTVFLAKVFTILMCCRICIGKGYRSRCILHLLR